VAGYVLRDSAVPALDDRLLYTDYCGGSILALAADPVTGEPRLVDTRLEATSPVAIVPGPDDAPWVLTLDGDVLELVEVP
jgi:streptogramin lyase